MVYDDENFIIIDPAEMTFVFELSDGECHQKHTGICSLERTVPDRTQDTGDESDYDYCPGLLVSIQQRGFESRIPIELIKYQCGHYAFSDGQHRICIAKKKGLKALAKIYSQDGYCDVCAGRPSDDSILR